MRTSALFGTKELRIFRNLWCIKRKSTHKEEEKQHNGKAFS